jgi:hypothetical protein
VRETAKILKKIRSTIPLEAWMWIAGLACLFFINPYQQQEFSLCPFHNLGIGFCPGCGLGRSIAFFYHGDIMLSLKTHPLGIIGLAIILYRVYFLINMNHKLKKWEAYHA